MRSKEAETEQSQEVCQDLKGTLERIFAEESSSTRFDEAYTTKKVETLTSWSASTALCVDKAKCLSMCNDNKKK
jgi:hypothetical protein